MIRNECMIDGCSVCSEGTKNLVQSLAEAPIGVKHDQDKSALGLVPPLAFLEVGRAFTAGLEKYGHYNYMGFKEVVRLCSGSLRHMFQFLSGEDLDKETGVHHLACVCSNAMIALEVLLRKGAAADDRYKGEPK